MKNKNTQQDYNKSVMRIYEINDRQRVIMTEWHKLEKEKKPLLEFVVQPKEEEK